jgi:hypothetical protein
VRRGRENAGAYDERVVACECVCMIVVSMYIHSTVRRGRCKGCRQEAHVGRAPGDFRRRKDQGKGGGRDKTNSVTITITITPRRSLAMSTRCRFVECDYAVRYDTMRCGC